VAATVIVYLSFPCPSKFVSGWSSKRGKKDKAQLRDVEKTIFQRTISSAASRENEMI
jgi:hypothetical protein